MALPTSAQEAKMLIWLRWLAVIPAAVLGWYIALLTGIILLDGVTSLCPAEQMISDLCGASWFRYAELAVFCFSAALAAFLVITFAVLVAPSQRIVVAWSMFMTGSFAAGYMAWYTSVQEEFVAALVGGLLGVAVITLFPQRRTLY